MNKVATPHPETFVSATPRVQVSRHCRSLLAAVTLALVCFGMPLAQAQSVSSTAKGTGVNVTIPNGFATVNAEDMRLMSSAGEVRFLRVWDGQEWKFQPQWEALSQSWRNLTGSQSADTTAGTVSGSGTTKSYGDSSSDSCWVWVDDDWQPSSGTVVAGGIPENDPLVPARSTPFNRTIGGSGTDYPPPQRVSIDYATLCAGVVASGFRDTEAIRRINELYLGDSGRYAFNNRSVLEKRAVQQQPAAPAQTLYAQLATGRVALAPQANTKGFRWSDRNGDWIDYDTRGQVVAYGDRNNNIIWMLRDVDGVLRGVADATGRVLWSMHYTGELLTEIRDYPAADISGDLPARSVKYQYDAKNRLYRVTDVRGNVTQYDYDVGNHLIKVTDPEGRVEQMAYNGDTVKQRTAPNGGVTDYLFEYDDANKQFTSKITGPETTAGRRVEDYTHNRVGKLVRQVVNGRTELEMQYDTGTRTEIQTNLRGFASKNVRNEFNQIVRHENEDGTAISVSYSAATLRPVEVANELGVKTQYQYDANGNLLRVTEAAGTADERVTEYANDSAGRPLRITRKGRTEAGGTVTPDAVWQIAYDARGQVAQTTDPEGKIRRYIFDRGGNLVSFTDARGNATHYEVDAEGHLIAITDTLGRSSHYEYDKIGNLTKEVDARGKTVLTAYNSMNQLQSLTNPLGGISRVEYDAQGLPIHVQDEDGQAYGLGYDNYQQLVRMSDALDNALNLGYQLSDGSPGSLFSPTDIQYPTFRQENRYDARERLTLSRISSNSADGSRISKSEISQRYDQAGRLVGETDPNGKVRSYAYDALGQLTEATDALGGKTRAAYDTRGNLIALTDARGNTTRFEYDRNDRLLRETLPLGQATRYEYDDAGNLASRIDALGNRIAYVFDAVNRLTEMRQYRAAQGGGSTLVRTTTYRWNETDQLTGWSDTDATRPAGQQTASAELSYDDARQKTGETVSYPTPQGSNTSLGYGYAYSLSGKKTRLIWADGTQIDYAYSAHGELESVSIPGEGTITMNQFKWTAPTQVTLPGGTTIHSLYDGLLQLESVQVVTAAQQNVLSLAHTWGKAFELQFARVSQTAGGATRTRDSTYTYDDEQRLTQVSTDTGGLFGTDTETFTLDTLANRTQHSKLSGNWAYDANNRLTQRGIAASYQYDDNGNLLQKTEGSRVTQYRYDTLNRLTEVSDLSDGMDKLVARYGYDPQSRRLWKEQYRDKDGNLLAQAKRTLFLYADEGLIAEATQSITLNADNSVAAGDAAPQITTQYGPRPGNPFNTGMLFVKTRASNGEDLVAYYHNNHLQTPVMATDKNGRVVWAAEYNAFGEATIVTPAATDSAPVITSNLRLPGQYLDSETGLYYNWYRYYDSVSGRFLSSDPIGFTGGDMNIYLYAAGNPMSLSDPTGLRSIFRKGGNTIYAYPKGDGSNESAKQGPHGDYHGHLNGQSNKVVVFDKDGNVIMEDPSKFSSQEKQFLSGLDENEKKYLRKACREVFHNNEKALPKLQEKYFNKPEGGAGGRSGVGNGGPKSNVPETNGPEINGPKGLGPKTNGVPAAGFEPGTYDPRLEPLYRPRMITGPKVMMDPFIIFNILDILLNAYEHQKELERCDMCA